MISYIIPTRDRHDTLHETLGSLSRLGPHDAEVIIADNASHEPVRVPATLDSGVSVRVLRLDGNLGAAARNHVAEIASGEWLVMLDDDSSPDNLGFIEVLRAAEPDVHAVAAEIHLPHQNGRAIREHGGLPEVFIGCGVAIRTDDYRRLGGYDASFGYYAEEYDLAARMLLAGGRIALDRRFRVTHRKVSQSRDFSRIVRNLVRNNSWVARRYCPSDDGWNTEAWRHITRYARIARKEHAIAGYARGLFDLATTWFDQPTTPMPQSLWDRFTGLHAARKALAHEIATRGPLGQVAIVAPGKNEWAVRQALDELGIATNAAPDHADTLVLGTLSPGPMLDAFDAWTSRHPRVVMPWLVDDAGCAIDSDQPPNTTPNFRPDPDRTLLAPQIRISA
ncbi:MAG: glycosyltransferase [Phycisphaerales bacterium]|nr:MAG: glycosyltransferase [Phycisphaerales bacterium]